jgi:hypothetical protein
MNVLDGEEIEERVVRQKEEKREKNCEMRDLSGYGYIFACESGVHRFIEVHHKFLITTTSFY